MLCGGARSAEPLRESVLRARDAGGVRLIALDIARLALVATAMHGARTPYRRASLPVEAGMNAEGWAALKGAFDELLELPTGRREEPLATIAASDPHFHRDSNRLLAPEARAERRLHLLAPLSRGGAGASGIAGPVAGAAPPDPLGLSGRSVSPSSSPAGRAAP